MFETFFHDDTDVTELLEFKILTRVKMKSSPRRIFRL